VVATRRAVGKSRRLPGDIRDSDTADEATATRAPSLGGSLGRRSRTYVEHDSLALDLRDPQECRVSLTPWAGEAALQPRADLRFDTRRASRIGWSESCLPGNELRDCSLRTLLPEGGGAACRQPEAATQGRDNCGRRGGPGQPSESSHVPSYFGRSTGSLKPWLGCIPLGTRFVPRAAAATWAGGYSNSAMRLAARAAPSRSTAAACEGVRSASAIAAPIDSGVWVSKSIAWPAR
jgi:hypothetical protein